MSFGVELNQDVVSVEPGTTVPFGITIHNRGDLDAEFELDIEGIDGVWRAIPVPMVRVPKSETVTERVFLKPPRESESAAGSYPFVVKVRNLETGEVGHAQSVLEVRAFHSLAAELMPRKGYYSPIRRGNTFELSVTNEGNTAHSVGLYGTDPEDACSYEFDPTRIQVAPGQTKTALVEVAPRRSQLVSSAKLIGFNITARSNDHSSIAAQVPGQLEMRSLLSPVSLATALVFAFLAFLWWINMPQPPTVSLSVDTMQVIRGKELKLAWKASDRSRVRLILDDGTAILENGAPEGVLNYLVKERDIVSIRAVATRDGMTGRSDVLQISVAEPEVVPSPEILELKPSARSVKIGNTFLLRYRFGPSVVSATLAPLGKELDPTVSQIEIPVDSPGDHVYEVSAKNKAGVASVKSFTVTGFDASDAQVLELRTDRSTATPADNMISLRWHVTRASRVDLKSSAGDTYEVEPKGSREFMITAKTTFTISATDDRGRVVSRQVTVNFREEPVVPAPTDGGRTDAGGTGANPDDPIIITTTGGGTGSTSSGTATTTGGGPVNSTSGGTTGRRPAP
jgi:hypothetical protein